MKEKYTKFPFTKELLATIISGSGLGDVTSRITEFYDNRFTFYVVSYTLEKKTAFKRLFNRYGFVIRDLTIKEDSIIGGYTFSGVAYYRSWNRPDDDDEQVNPVVKYVRTRSSILRVLGETDSVYKVEPKNKELKPYSLSKHAPYVVSVADSVEELCDEFIFHDENGRVYFIRDRYDFFPAGTYGCILTDKGLIFVAYLENLEEGGWILL